MPAGIYLSQKTSIFKPKASSYTGYTPGGVCGEGPYSLFNSCVNGSPRLTASWNIPEKYGCNVFIKDNSTSIDYTISNECNKTLYLEDLGGNQIKEGGNYTLFVSNGDTAGCYNISVSNIITHCAVSATSTPIPSQRAVCQYPNLTASQLPLPSFASQISQVFVGGLAVYGTGALNDPTLNLSKSLLCSASRAQNLLIEVKYSPSFADGTDTRVFTIKFKLPDNSSVCSVAASTLSKPTAPEDSCDRYRNDQVNIKWLPVTNAYKYKLFIDDLSNGRELTLDDPNCLNSNLEDKCYVTQIPDTRENPIIVYIRPGYKYKIWVQAYDLSNNLSEPSEKTDMICGDLTPRILSDGRKIIDFPCYGLNPYPKSFPVKRKSDKQCFYTGISCYDDDRYTLDFSCDTKHLYTRDDFSVNSQSIHDLNLISSPEITNASCNNGILNVSWKDGGPQYELRAAKNLTQEQVEVIWGKDNSNRPDFSEGNDVKVSDYNQTSFSKNVGANNQFYTLWIHSKNQYGTGNQVYYPESVRCALPAEGLPKTVSSITVNNQILDLLTGNSLALILASSETNIPIQVSLSNGESINNTIRFIYSPPQITKPSSLSASCTNGVLTATWSKVESAINYELRGGKGLTDRPNDQVWENFPESDKIIGRQVTNCSTNLCSYSTSAVQNGAAYFLWVHSRTNTGISDATKLSSPVVCTLSTQPNPSPPTIQSPPSSSLPLLTSASCNNGVINVSWIGSGSSYELRAGMNLTKDQILDGTTWDNGHPNSNDLVSRNLTSTSFSKSVGNNNQFYTIWIHSRNSSGVLSDRVFYPDRVYCR